MGKLRAEQPEHRAAIDELLADVEAALTGPAFWAPFVNRCHAAGIARVSEWLNAAGKIVEEQFKRRGPRSARPADMPLSTSPLDAFTNPIRAAIGPRAYGLKNRQRTNRMLTLTQLHANARTMSTPTSGTSVSASRPTRAGRASPVGLSSTAPRGIAPKDPTHRGVHSRIRMHL